MLSRLRSPNHVDHDQFDRPTTVICASADNPSLRSPWLWRKYQDDDGVECAARITGIPNVTKRVFLRVISEMDVSNRSCIDILRSQHIAYPIHALWYGEGFYTKFIARLVLYISYVALTIIDSVLYVNPADSHRSHSTDDITLSALILILALYHLRHGKLVLSLFFACFESSTCAHHRRMGSILVRREAW